MRHRHFETLKPICPVCQGAERESRLAIATIEKEVDGVVLEGVLHCTRSSCQREVPVLDGVPMIVADLRHFVNASLAQLQARDDLSATLESLLGDCCGPGSALDATRQQLSSYAWDHYGSFDEERSAEDPSAGSAARVLERLSDLAGKLPTGPRLDIGCSVGGTTFELASVAAGEGDENLVLGVDLNVAMLRIASRVLLRGEARFPLRRVGVVYDRCELAVERPKAELVDFWACDAQALPFADATFAAAASLNVIDCVASPVAALSEQARVLAAGGKALISSPYDWSPGATPVEAWIGGHSQRSAEMGASEAVLRRWLGESSEVSAELRLIDEDESVPWTVRLHERSTVDYRVHLLAAERV